MNKSSQIIFDEEAGRALNELLSSLEFSSLFFVCDSNVAPLWLQSVKSVVAQHSPQEIIIPAGEPYKNLDTLSQVWRELSEKGGNRQSIVISLGGGVTTDLGGFAAATFKRGIRTINIPTTLLGAADAAVGGKTGIDFCGLKNEIGAFHTPLAVIISTKFFETLPHQELSSGFAEVLKMALLTSPKLYMALIKEGSLPSGRLLQLALRHAIQAKEVITTQDPLEKGVRRILNLGHTAGHAYESLALEKGTPMTHGCAVAHGILTAMRISEQVCGFPSEETERYRRYLNANYPPLPFTECDTPRLLQLMLGDKKNSTADSITFILLSRLGEYSIHTLPPAAIAPLLL